MNGKGSKTRPLSVKYETFADNWDNIKGFNKNKPPINPLDNKLVKKPHVK